MRILFLFIFWISTFAIAYATDLPSIEDLIYHETQKIQEAEIHENADLSLKYINRAESYIVAGQFEKALEDLEKGREVAWQRGQKNAGQRTLIDLLVAYACLGDDEKALSTTEQLQDLLNSPDSHGAKKGCLCKDENYVNGPDKEPAPGWCEQTVNSTADSLLDLVQKSRLGQFTKDSISYFLEQLRNSGLKCCTKGEPWKGCVGPLAKRMVEWEASGVPADPKWD